MNFENLPFVKHDGEKLSCWNVRSSGDYAVKKGAKRPLYLFSLSNPTTPNIASTMAPAHSFNGGGSAAMVHA